MNNTMPDREKVIKGLEAHGYTDCTHCPYWGTGHAGLSECRQLARDALALLKAQEPHIISIEEVKSLENGSIVWEETNHPECEPLSCQMISKRKGYADSIIDCGGDMPLDGLTETPKYFDGYKLRYWTGKPSEEQRKAVAW